MNILSTEINYRREVKSYMLRGSRMTMTQKEGLKRYWSSFVLDSDEKLDYSTIFQRSAPTILEVGFGMGNSLLHFARSNPEINFIGVEVHKPGIGALLWGINENKLENVRIYCADAHIVLSQCILNNSLQGVLLFFPDPWPKRRHQKRRIVQPNFVDLVHQKLITGGYFHLATDVEDYAIQMQEVTNSHNGLAILNEQEKLPHSLMRPKTKFERRGEILGHTITDLILVKKG